MAPSTGLEALVNPGRILLVEDNPDDVALTLRALKSHNITNVRQVDSALTTAGPAKRPHKQMCPNLCPGSTGSHQQGVLSRCAVERRRSESNRRIEVLQTSALPLGYGAARRKLAIYLDFLNPPPEVLPTSFKPLSCRRLTVPQSHERLRSLRGEDAGSHSLSGLALLDNVE